MRKAKIVTGGIYTRTDARGKVLRRQVLELCTARFTVQGDRDCVRYVVLAGPQQGREAVMTRARFAAWAAAREDEAEQAGGRADDAR